MAYSNKAFFQLKLKPEIYSEIVPDDATLSQEITTADGEIDSYLRKVTPSLPLNPVPPKIRECSFDITVYGLYKKVPGNESPLKVKEAYDDAIRYLTKIANGVISLLPAPAVVETDSQVTVTGDDVRFSDSDL